MSLTPPQDASNVGTDAFQHAPTQLSERESSHIPQPQAPQMRRTRRDPSVHSNPDTAETWSKGVVYDSRLTVVDRDTKVVHLLLTQKNCTAVGTDELVLLNVFKYLGLMEASSLTATQNLPHNGD